MWTTAEVGERSLGVGADGAILQVLVDMLALIFLSVGTESGKGIGFGYLLAHHRLVFLGQFFHLCLDFREVILRDGHAFRRHHVVEESVFHGRSETELYARIEFLECLGQQVSRRMPEGMLAFLVLKLEQGDGGIDVNRAV